MRPRALGRRWWRVQPWPLPGSPTCAGPAPSDVRGGFAGDGLAIDLADDFLDRAQHAVEEGPRVAHEAVVLALALVGERVVAAAAALGVLPAALDQAALLELAQQRVHRVRVHAQDALGHRADPLH